MKTCSTKTILEKGISQKQQKHCVFPERERIQHMNFEGNNFKEVDETTG